MCCGWRKAKPSAGGGTGAKKLFPLAPVLHIFIRWLIINTQEGIDE